MGVDVPDTAVASVLREQEEWESEGLRRSSLENLHKRCFSLLFFFLSSFFLSFFLSFSLSLFYYLFDYYYYDYYYLVVVI